ncbi:MAG: bifunctional adenosylcobinamide kinase/adenosylcobinamide-phosphate guanylyltransferase [Oscillospiraceae bacterium]|nr:bifunctional adenosylcobinamide kinase/adenosylcobinamide-phosphate guanylyltransferase [Oscillospiraceae bacterium]
MILIIGGTCAGKTEFAKKYFQLSDAEILDASEIRNVQNAKCIRNYHLLIKKLCQEQLDPLAFTEQLMQENPYCIIIMNEVGGGIVPLEKSERLWREACGKTSCLLAEHAEKVIRIICGIPTVIKGECL